MEVSPGFFTPFGDGVVGVNVGDYLLLSPTPALHTSTRGGVELAA